MDCKATLIVTNSRNRCRFDANIEMHTELQKLHAPKYIKPSK